MQTRLVPGCRGVVELAKVLFAVWMLGSSYTSQYRFCGSIVCNRTRFPTFPSWVMRTRIRSAKGCRTTSVRTSLMTFELCFCVSMLGLPGERDQSRVATPPSRLSATHHHPVTSYTMTITLGSRGKGRDLEMGWWQYLPLGERSQRYVNAFVDALRLLKAMQTGRVVRIIDNIYGTSYEAMRHWTAVPLSEVLRTPITKGCCPGRQLLQSSNGNHNFK
jgi:hypothetical protein